MKICATVILINDEGYVLGVSRKDNHDDMNLPGGKSEIEDDNNPMKTAIRETKTPSPLERFKEVHNA